MGPFSSPNQGTLSPFIQSPNLPICGSGRTTARPSISLAHGVIRRSLPFRRQRLPRIIWVPCALRTAYGVLGDRLWAIASRAAQVTEWDSNHRFCGRCAKPTVKLRTELGRQCPACGLIAFPRISPATITLIERGDQVLLAHGAHHATGMYALIAGFVEAGETLEECVSREVREEIGIEVDQIRYFASQSWPFPHSIMLGFNARYKSGEITVNPEEITDARWFSVDDLPMIPMRMSIARRLIDDYAARHGRDPDTL